jgi:hypothetical protein
MCHASNLTTVVTMRQHLGLRYDKVTSSSSLVESAQVLRSLSIRLTRDVMLPNRWS